MNITLIGMPGAGKSHISKLLAGQLGYNVIELDKLFEGRYDNRPLQEILEELGEERMLREQGEDAIVQTSDRTNSVISTGGSIIYTPEAMRHLQNISKIMYLDAPLEVIAQRIAGTKRGLVKGKHAGLPEIYAERIPLYRSWAFATIDATKSPDNVVEAILQSITSIN